MKRKKRRAKRRTKLAISTLSTVTRNLDSNIAKMCIEYSPLQPSLTRTAAIEIIVKIIIVKIKINTVIVEIKIEA